jgi:hypothetical protein
MIAREPLKRDPNAGRKPERAVLRNLGAGCSRLPAIAILPPALERRIVGLRELVSGESRLCRIAADQAHHRSAEAQRGSRRDVGADPCPEAAAGRVNHGQRPRRERLRRT